MPDTLADILLIVFIGGSIQRRFRLEIADTELHAAAQKSDCQRQRQPECFIEFLLRLTFALTQKALLCNGLRSLYKLQERFQIQGPAFADLAAISRIGGFLPAVSR